VNTLSKYNKYFSLNKYYIIILKKLKKMKKLPFSSDEIQMAVL